LKNMNQLGMDQSTHAPRRLTVVMFRPATSRNNTYGTSGFVFIGRKCANNATQLDNVTTRSACIQNPDVRDGSKQRERELPRPVLHSTVLYVLAAMNLRV
jgi:hypothetical protein